jgi:tRNA A-37 threonylcarbamoyl transferase component Bud32
MTPDRWRQIGQLFDAGVRLDPTERDAWLCTACAGDDDLRAEVGRLLAQDDQADRDGILIAPAPTSPPADRTASWFPRAEVHPSARTGPTDSAGETSEDDTAGFTPRPAIAHQTPRLSISEPPEVVRSRLRELPMIYVLMLVIATVWRRAVLPIHDPDLLPIDVGIILALVAMIALLSSRWPISLARLKVLELAMVGVMASRLAVVQYRLMLTYSLRDDRMMAQLTMKNVVFLTSVLILTYALYVPKSWRRAALVVGPLALLPFAILGVMIWQFPDAMAWLWEGWKFSDTPRIHLMGFDAMMLIMLAVGATFGAHAMSRLRRQVVEARQLGQYRLRRLLGAGGMGEVYLAEHQLLKRRCAVKLIRSDAATDPCAQERFEREVRLTATLSHPNTVDIYDYGRAEDGTYYYVMEYLPGLNLAELVERYGPLPPERAVYLLRQVCSALREAHAAGLLHRDLKPSNIIAARRGGMDDVAKLVDFGLVRPTETSGEPCVSAVGRVFGTPLFMSPEQATGAGELDERSDIYSLGAVAYFVLTGRPPFEGDNGIAVLIAHARDAVMPPSLVRPGIPRDLELVVLRCLAKDTSERFASAESLERALGECDSAGGWDRDLAARWWREYARATATPVTVN